MRVKQVSYPTEFAWLNAWALLSTLIFGLSCGNARAEQNLVQNGSFESGATNGVPTSWWLYQPRGTPELAIDTGIKHDGATSLSLLCKDDPKFSVVSAPFEVSPADDIRFEAWMRPEKISEGNVPGYVGLGFRDNDGAVFARHYLKPESLKPGEWSLVSGAIKVPSEARTCEVHLGYTNSAFGRVWIDDVKAVITSPISMALISKPKPWVGEQELQVKVINRSNDLLRAALFVETGKETNDAPVVVPPGGNATAKMPISFSGAGSHSYRVRLVGYPGIEWRVLQGKVRTSGPMSILPPCPYYHVVGQGNGETRVPVQVNMAPALRSGMTVSVSLADSIGKQLATSKAPVAQTNITEVKLKVPVGSAGDYKLLARLLDAKGKQVGKAESSVHVRQQDQVTLGSDGFLRINGKPHFPIGMYNGGTLQEMSDAGFSGTHQYAAARGESVSPINESDKFLQELLDRNYKAGIRMMVEFPRRTIVDKRFHQVERRIETFRNHPGLLCWGSEETVARGSAPLSNVEALYQLVHKLDTNHVLVLGDSRDVSKNMMGDRRNFFPDQAMDVGIWWWYPIPLKASTNTADLLEGREPGSKLLEPPTWLTTTQSKKPLWIAIQAYQQPRQTSRFPTPDEYRCMAYLSIINGVKGLWFYTAHGQVDYLGKPSGLLNRPAEGNWNYVKKLVTELRGFSPVIMANVPKTKVSKNPAQAPVEFATRELDGKLYILAANKSDREQSVEFSADQIEGKKPSVLYEQRTVEIKGNSLKDSFGPFAVHVYCIQ